MADVVKSNQSWAIKKETTEGTYAAPTLSTDFVQVMQDGAELSRSKETIERNVYTGTIGKVAPRTSTFQASGSLAIEAKGHSTEGHAPQADVLFESALGIKRQSAEITSEEDHTESLINLASTTSLNVGDIIMVKESGGFHVSPIASKTSSSITLMVPAAQPFSDNVKIAAFTTYTVAESGHPSFSVSRYLEGAVLQQASGCKVSNLALEGFSTGQLASFKFGFEGLNFDSSLTAPPVSPSYDGALPPIILSAFVYMDGVSIDVNELAFTIENSLSFKTATNASNGRIASRPTARTVSGTFNPFMRSDSMSNFQKFKNNTAFSIFGYMQLPSENDNEPSSIVAFYMPNCTMTELGEADQDGLMQDNISFSANRGTGSTSEIFLTFI